MPDALLESLPWLCVRGLLKPEIVHPRDYSGGNSNDSMSKGNDLRIPETTRM